MTRSRLMTLVLFLVAAGLARAQESQDVMRLFSAAQAGDVDNVGVALDLGTNVNIQATRDGSTALHVAARAGQAGVVRLLLDRGADPLLRDSMNMVPLMHTVDKDAVECARMLLDAGTPVDVTGFTSRDGAAESTTLILAAERGALEVAKLLVTRGADVNHVNGFERTALFWARKAGKKEMASFLETLGASADPAEARPLSEAYQAELAKSPPPPTMMIRTTAEEPPTDGGTQEQVVEDMTPAPKPKVAAPQGKVAAAELKRRIHDNPKDAAAYRDYGVLLRKAGKLEAAAKALSRAVALDPRDASARSHLCLVLLARGDREAAVREYQAVRKLDPDRAKKLRPSLERK